MRPEELTPTTADLALDLRQALADLESVDYGHCANLMLWSIVFAAIRRCLAAEGKLAQKLHIKGNSGVETLCTLGALPACYAMMVEEVERLQAQVAAQNVNLHDLQGALETSCNLRERAEADVTALKAQVLDAVGSLVLERWETSTPEMQRAATAALVMELNRCRGFLETSRNLREAAEAENVRLRNLCRSLEVARDERDSFERDLEQISRTLGCGHVEDGLAHCVDQTIEDLHAEVARLKAQALAQDHCDRPVNVCTACGKPCEVTDWCNSVCCAAEVTTRKETTT